MKYNQKMTERLYRMICAGRIRMDGWWEPQYEEISTKFRYNELVINGEVV